MRVTRNEIKLYGLKDVGSDNIESSKTTILSSGQDGVGKCYACLLP